MGCKFVPGVWAYSTSRGVYVKRVLLWYGNELGSMLFDYYCFHSYFWSLFGLWIRLWDRLTTYFSGHALIVRLRLGNVNFCIFSPFFILKYVWGQLGITAKGSSSSSSSGGSYLSPHIFFHFFLKWDYMYSPGPKFICV